MVCLIIVFLTLSFLEIRVERRQKPLSVKLSFATVFAFKHQVSAVYVTPHDYKQHIITSYGKRAKSFSSERGGTHSYRRALKG